jgi:type IV pilus assembly protein PilA
MKGRNAQAGFTFIELMSVVAIIGILTAIMGPNIKNYSARAKISEVILAFGPCRNVVSETYLAGGPLPAADSWGCESAAPTSKYVAEISVDDNGVIRILTGGAMGDGRVAPKYIYMAPMNRSGTVMDDDDRGNGVYRWRCGGGLTEIDPTFLPSSCRG